MRKQFTREEIQWLIDNFEDFMELAEDISRKLNKLYKHKYDFISGDYLWSVDDSHITIRDACDDTIKIPIEYFYDDAKIQDLNKRIAEKEKEEAERSAYYKKLEQDHEKNELRRLMKKYPEMVDRLGGKS